MLHVAPDATKTGWITGRDNFLGAFTSSIKTNIKRRDEDDTGSHFWDDDQDANPGDPNVTEMDIGEAAFMLASTFHGGSTNYLKEENRLVYAVFICKRTLRREFATLVEYPPPQVVKGQNKEVIS